MMAGLILVALSLSFMLSRVVSPYGAKSEGKPLKTIALNYRERLAMQQINLCALAVILLLGAVGHWVRLPFEILAMLAAYGILMVPVRYQFTTQGIGLNSVVFRRWSELASFQTSAQKIALSGRPGNGRLAVWLRGPHQAEALPLLRRYLQESSRPQRSVAASKGGLPIGRLPFRRLLPRRS